MKRYLKRNLLLRENGIVAVPQQNTGNAQQDARSVFNNSNVGSAKIQMNNRDSSTTNNPIELSGGINDASRLESVGKQIQAQNPSKPVELNIQNPNSSQDSVSESVTFSKKELREWLQRI